MTARVTKLLNKNQHSFDELVELLSVTSAEETQLILNKGLEVKAAHPGRKVYLRGLIELSNVCAKNCYYCGIRGSNHHVERYTLSDEEVFHAADFAWKNGFGSLVIQTGERQSVAFTKLIAHLLKGIHERTQNELTITLSCGEQTLDTYRLWREAGAERYLLRIETTNEELFYKIHPRNKHHNFQLRLKALAALKQAGYQVGTGVMIGLPQQTIGDLANDLLYFRSLDIDMVGMGPYIEHAETPLFDQVACLWPANERFRVGLLMIALLRINMPWINIAASTALETLDPQGRQKGLLAGANVVMPNLTPVVNRKQYLLYDNKPNLEKDASLSTVSLNESIASIGETINYRLPGDSIHFLKRTGQI